VSELSNLVYQVWQKLLSSYYPLKHTYPLFQVVLLQLHNNLHKHRCNECFRTINDIFISFSPLVVHSCNITTSKGSVLQAPILSPSTWN
jgi:hypothetical protein